MQHHAPLNTCNLNAVASSVKAELTVDRPKIATTSDSKSSNSSSEQQQQQQQASACPFLASLPSPPLVKVPWHKRFQQLFAPQKFQAGVLAGHSSSSMVQVQKQIGFTNFVMPNDPELVREAFAGELDGTTLQSDIKSFGGCLLQIYCSLRKCLSIPKRLCCWQV
jgi:hypothetical protein